MPALLRPRFWGGHLLMLAALAVALLLGLWQLHAWQAGREAEQRDLSSADPVPLTRVLGPDGVLSGSDLGRPVSFRGTWLAADTMYVENRQLEGRTGYWVMTPVRVGQSAVPVVRGWAPRALAPAPRGPATVTGWLQASEGSGALDDDPHDDVLPEMRIASIVEHVDMDLYGAYVVSRSPDAGLAAVPPESVPKVSGTTSLRNLLYALQWWVFGGFAVYIWWRWCRDVLGDLRHLEEPQDTPAEQVRSRA